MSSMNGIWFDYLYLLANEEEINSQFVEKFFFHPVCCCIFHLKKLFCNLQNDTKKKDWKKTKDERTLVEWRDRLTEWKTGHSISINFSVMDFWFHMFQRTNFVNKKKTIQLATSLNLMELLWCQEIVWCTKHSQMNDKRNGKNLMTKWVIERIFNLSMQFALLSILK